MLRSQRACDLFIFLASLATMTVTHVLCYLIPPSSSSSSTRGRHHGMNCHHQPIRNLWTTSRKSSSSCRQSHNTQGELLASDLVQRQLQEAQETLQRIDMLQSSILDDDDYQNGDASSLSHQFDSKVILQQVQELEQQVDQITFVPPGLDRASYLRTIGWYLRLPYSVRFAIGQALDLPENVACRDWKQAPAIVTKLYQQYQSTDNDDQGSNANMDRFTKRLQQGFKAYQERRALLPPKSKRTALDAKNASVFDKFKAVIRMVMTDGFDEELRKDTAARNGVGSEEEKTFYYAMLGRVTRKEGRGPTTQDLQTLLYVLDHAADGNDKSKKIFTVSAVQTIDEGYVLRGTNHKSTSTALLEAIDAKFKSPETSVSTPQVFFMPDYFCETLEDFFSDADPVLVLLNQDVSPTTPSYVLVLSTMTALATTLLFAVGVYGANDLITQRLTEANALQDYENGLDWFNGMMWMDMIAPLLVIQVAHDVGNWLIAWKDQFRMGIPTLVPFWQLPNMGTWTPIVSSPKNQESLFDFACLGSVMGLAASAAFLMAGLQATVGASPDVAQYFPALTVSTLKLSTLGGTLVDYVLGGGNGFILLQDPADLVPLHPYVICGLSGLMIQAIGLLPSGSNDGGRMAQAVFGRRGHTAVTTVVWLGMLSTSLLFEQHDVFLGALIFNSFIQSDKEVPCRDETSNVDVFRGLVAVIMWVLAIFILTPITSQ